MPNILVVDDSETQIVFVKSVLQNLGVSVRSAANGREALDQLNEHPMDLVVTDMRMPVMDGLELIREMQTHHPSVPAILLTGFGSEILATEALSAGAVNFLSKEYIHIQLRDTTQRVIRLANANAQMLAIKGALRPSTQDFLIDSALERVSPLVCLQLQMLTAMRVLRTSERIRIAEALHYLYYLLILHENLELPVSKTPLSLSQATSLIESIEQADEARARARRTIATRIEVDQEAVRFTLSYQGDGEAIRKGPLPGTPDSFSDERGRGMLLLTSVMDEVFLGRVGEITLVKNFKS